MDFTKYLMKYLLYPYMEIKNKNKIRTYLKELKEHETWDRKRMQDFQKDKLKKLLTYSIENVPKYKDKNYLKDEIIKDSFKAIKKFPICKKEDVRKNSKAYISDLVDNKELIENRTGGSTGEPLKFYMDRKTVEYYEAARYRGLSWSTISPYDRSLMLWGNSVDMSKGDSFRFYIKERYLKNRIIIPAGNIKADKIYDYVNMIYKFKPDYIYAYASALHLFAKLVEKADINFRYKLKAAVYTAEAMEDYKKKEIEDILKTKVIAEYGARDAGILAYEASDSNLYLCEDNAFFEIEDKRLIVTDLNNFSQVRLRYDIGDVLQLSEKNGIFPFKIIEKIEGREDSFLIKKDGSYVQGVVLANNLRKFDNLKKFQFIQSDIDNAIIKIALYEKSDADVKAIVDVCHTLLGDINIKTEIVEDIEPSKSGKFRCVIRKFEISI